MTISPIQPLRGDYVTRRELNGKFDEQKDYMNAGFDKAFELSEKIEGKLDSFRQDVSKRFDTLENRFDTLENRFDTLEGKVDDISAQVKLLTKSVNRLIK